MRKSVGLVLGVLLWVLLVTAASHAGEQFASQSIAAEMVTAAGNYWTKERMTKAKPYPSPDPDRKPVPVPGYTLEHLSGPPGFDPGERARTAALSFLEDDSKEPAPVEASVATEASEEPSEAVATIGYEYPPPQTTFRVLPSLYGNSLSTYPYSAVGKVFFSSGKNDYYCSGAAIGGRAVLTAGHCVSDGKGNYHTNWVFVPSYQNNAKPYGTWSAFWLGTFPEWHTNADYGRDVGFAAVADRSRAKLANKVGSLGFAWNQSRIQHWNSFGYPVAVPWKGKYLVETQASYATTDTAFAPTTIGIGTSQTEGSSGGPWIKSFAPGITSGGNYANGVNSRVYMVPNQPKQIYSPYFDSKVKSLKDTAVAK